jgi:hypothetical protein
MKTTSIVLVALLAAFIIRCMADFFFGLNIVPNEFERMPGRLPQWLFPME